MSSKVLQKVLDILNDSAGISDTRMNRFLMKSPLELIIILIVYLAIIYKIGPRLMKNRKPYSLRKVLIVYNCVQIVANAFLFIVGIPAYRRCSILCTPYDPSNSDFSLYVTNLHYGYLLLKYFDLVETVFYVLRKKEKQISFLHVYHHFGILVSAWVSGKYFPGGQATFVGFYNTLVHCIMYCYYLVSSMSPNGMAVWWKKYVTALQIVQHCVIFVSVFPSVINKNCSYPKPMMGFFSLNVLAIIYLFAKFYKDTYLTERKLKP